MNRQVLNMRREARQHITYHVGANSQFLFCHDPWVRVSSLLQSFDASIISMAASHTLHKVCILCEMEHGIFPHLITLMSWILELWSVQFALKAQTRLLGQVKPDR